MIAVLRIAGLATVLLAATVRAAAADSAQAASAPAGELQKYLRETIREFTFENSLGADVPLNWRKISGSNYPAYTKGKFDSAACHGGQSSYCITLNGGNCAYEYDPWRTAIEPAFDYCLEGWVKTEGLRYNAARLSLRFNDQQGRVIMRSTKTSRAVSGNTDWALLEVHISPTADRDGQPYAVPPRFIGLSMETLGGEAHDVSGRVWFDDLRLYRVPRLRIGVAANRLLFVQGEPVVLELAADGLLGAAFPGQLTVRDDRGKVVFDQPVALAAQAEGGPRAAVTLPALVPSAYHASYDLAAAGPTVLVQRASFAVLAPRSGQAHLVGAGFGLADTTGLDDPQALAEAVRELGVRTLKVPLWRRDSTHEELERGRAGVDLLIRGLRHQDVQLVGVLESPLCLAPAQADPGAPGLANLLAQKEDLWQRPLALTISRYAGVINAWQLGSDADQTLTRLQTEPGLLDGAARQIDRLTAAAPLGFPWPAFYALPRRWSAGGVPGAAAPTPFAGAGFLERADFVALSIGHEITPDQIAQYLPDSIGGRTGDFKILLTLEPISRARHDPDDRIFDLAARVLAAKQAGVTDIFFGKLIGRETGLFRGPRQPSELFLVARTLCDLLGGTRFAGWLPLEHSSSAMVFQRDDGAELLVLWNEDARFPVKEPLYLGEDLVQVDLWGNRTPVPRFGSVSSVTVQAMPLIITNIDPQISRTRRSFRLRDGVITAAYRRLAATVEFANGFSRPVAGTVRLAVPKGWQVEPQTVRFSLAEGERLAQPLALTVPYNETVGEKEIRAEFTVEGRATYQFTALARARFDMATARARATAFQEGPNIVIEHEIACTASEPTSYQSSVQIPGLPMLTHFIPKLRPGESVVRRFLIPYTASLEDRAALVGLRDETPERGFANLLLPLRGVHSGTIARSSSPVLH